MSRFVDPAICLKPPQRLHDALFNREFGFPARRLNFLRVEKDEGIVANPSAIPAGEVEARLQAQCTADEPDAVLHLHKLRRTEVVDLRVVLRVARGAILLAAVLFDRWKRRKQI